MVHFLEIYSKNNILAQTLHHITDKFMKSIFIEISKPIDNVVREDGHKEYVKIPEEQGS